MKIVKGLMLAIGLASAGEFWLSNRGTEQSTCMYYRDFEENRGDGENNYYFGPLPTLLQGHGMPSLAEALRSDTALTLAGGREFTSILKRGERYCLNYRQSESSHVMSRLVRVDSISRQSTQEYN